MVTRRTAKTKGSQFEYDVWASLKQFYPNTKLAKEMGYQQQFDLINNDAKFVVECKRHKTLSWNEAKKYFNKLEEQKLPNYETYLIFKSNQQPVLVMYWTSAYGVCVTEFEEYFAVPFIKHKPFNRK